MSAILVAVEVAGWAGAALILLAYLLLSAEKLTGQSLVYQGMNVAGGARFRDQHAGGTAPGPAAALQRTLWLLIGGIASVRIVRRAKGRH